MRAPADVLKRRGVAVQRIPHGRATSAIEEARELGMRPAEVLKSVLIRTDRGDALAVIQGSRRLDMHRVREAVGDKHARLATEEEIETLYPDVELGALPPLGSLLGVRTYVDPEVFDHEVVVFAGGSQWESDRAEVVELFRDEPVTVVGLTRAIELVPEF